MFIAKAKEQLYHVWLQYNGTNIEAIHGNLARVPGKDTLIDEFRINYPGADLLHYRRYSSQNFLRCPHQSAGATNSEASLVVLSNVFPRSRSRDSISPPTTMPENG